MPERLFCNADIGGTNSRFQMWSLAEGDESAAPTLRMDKRCALRPPPPRCALITAASLHLCVSLLTPAAI